MRSEEISGQVVRLIKDRIDLCNTCSTAAKVLLLLSCKVESRTHRPPPLPHSPTPPIPHPPKLADFKQRNEVQQVYLSYSTSFKFALYTGGLTSLP